MATEQELEALIDPDNPNLAQDLRRAVVVSALAYILQERLSDPTEITIHHRFFKRELETRIDGFSYKADAARMAAILDDPEKIKELEEVNRQAAALREAYREVVRPVDWSEIRELLTELVKQQQG